MQEVGYLEFGGFSGYELSADLQCLAVYNTVLDTPLVNGIYQKQLNYGCSALNLF